MNKMIISNLVHRPVRSLISVIAIAVEVTLILLIVGLSLGMLNDAKNRTVGMGADLMVQPPGSSNLMGISGAPAPIKIADVLRKLPHVAVVSPVVWQLNTARCARSQSTASTDIVSATPPVPVYCRWPVSKTPTTCSSTTTLPLRSTYKVGDTIKILNHDFRVSGIVLNGQGRQKICADGDAARPHRCARKSVDLLREG